MCRFYDAYMPVFAGFSPRIQRKKAILALVPSLASRVFARKKTRKAREPSVPGSCTTSLCPRHAKPPTQLRTHLHQQASASALLSELHCLNPVITARADMVAFNKQCTRENATSFVQSITWQTRHKGCCDLEEQQPHNLLSNDEEEHWHASATATGKQPVSLEPPTPLTLLNYNILMCRQVVANKSLLQATWRAFANRFSLPPRSIYLCSPELKGSIRPVQPFCIGLR
jgi:hypothetical protein